MQSLPGLEYTGQTTSEILAHLETHSDFSLLYAFEWGIQAKARNLGGEHLLTDEERVVLAVLSLEREVNNGGYKQFFWNSSRRFTPIIAASLRQIGCERTAVLTERAISALALIAVTVHAVTQEIERQDEARDAKLDALNTEFYTFTETTEKLLRFIVEAQANIRVLRTDDYPQRPRKRLSTPADKLFFYLQFEARSVKAEWTADLLQTRQAARDIARRREIAASDADVEPAVTLFAFQQAVQNNDLASAQSLAAPSIESMGTNGFHILAYRKWVAALVAAEQRVKADKASIAYLEWLDGGILAPEATLNKLVYWAELVRDHRTVLTESAQYFAERHPDLNLDNLPAPRLILPAKELYIRSKPPRIEAADR